tara:strand:- start:462 stop:764 length:303 start_codon:yes stop_codon:yes gene_type:complete
MQSMFEIVQIKSRQVSTYFVRQMRASWKRDEYKQHHNKRQFNKYNQQQQSTIYHEQHPLVFWERNAREVVQGRWVHETNRRVRQIVEIRITESIGRCVFQ